MKLVAVTALVTFALLGATAAPASAAPSPGSYVSKYLALYHQLALIVKSDKGSCTKMGADLAHWAAKNKATIATLNAEAPKFTGSTLALAALKGEKQLIADAQTIALNLPACAATPAVAKAFAAASKVKKP